MIPGSIILSYWQYYEEFGSDLGHLLSPKGAILFISNLALFGVVGGYALGKVLVAADRKRRNEN
jgi:hypothetical protein